MALVNQGWYGLQNSKPKDPTDIIAWCQLDVTSAIYKMSSTFGTPVAGSWTSPSVVIQDPVTLSYTNATSRSDLAMIANSINIQSLMSNMNSAALPVQDLFFLFGNDSGRTDWQMNIPINFGAVNYNKFELSILENLCTRGDEQGLYPVLDFGSGPFTGNKILKIIFNNYYGLINIGIHIEKSDNSKSSFLILRSIIQPVSTGYNCCNKDAFINTNSFINNEGSGI